MPSSHRVGTALLMGVGVVLLGLGMGLQAPEDLGADPNAIQDEDEAGTPTSTPRIPGAVARAPEWLKDRAFFDVDAFFQAPPPDQNAAPLYLDALFEFSTEVAGCFPAGPGRVRREQAVSDRSRRFFALSQALTNNNGPRTVTNEQIDAVLAEFDEGFRKLDAAQGRPRCLFETGLGLTALLPHAQAARQVVRVAAVRLKRDLERGELLAAMREIPRCLRLARDLQPRGFLITQLVVAAMNRMVYKEMVLPILASPRLRPNHCDLLLRMLAEHEAQSRDGYTEGLRMEYLTARVLLRDLVQNQARLAKDLGLAPGKSVVKALVEPEVVAMQAAPKAAPEAGKGQAAPKAAPPAPPAPEPLPPDIDARVARATPAEMDRAVEQINVYYRKLFDLKGTPFAARLAGLPDPMQSFGNDDLARMIAMAQPALTALVRALGNEEATLHGTECLVALRRWQLTHDGPPPDLAAVCQAAGMKAVPADPYDGKPMRLAIVAGEPVVYAIGQDGKDDGGRKDSRNDMQPGDLVFRLPPRPR